MQSKTASLVHAHPRPAEVTYQWGSGVSLQRLQVVHAKLQCQAREGIQRWLPGRWQAPHHTSTCAIELPVMMYITENDYVQHVHDDVMKYDAMHKHVRNAWVNQCMLAKQRKG